MTPEKISFAARDGVQLEGLLQTPASDRRLPAAVITHSHSEQAGGHMHAHVLRAVAVQLAHDHVVALRFNFRGVQGSAGAFEDGKGELHDVGGAVDYLRARPDVDPDQIALVGYSFGSRVIVPYALGDPRICAIATFGMPARRFVPQPLDLRVPILLLIGDADTRTPLLDIERFAAQQPTATVQVLRGADHFYRGREREVAHTIADFLKSYWRSVKLNSSHVQGGEE